MSLKILVEILKGRNLYLIIFVLSFKLNILNYPFEALNPQSPLFFRIDRLLLDEINLLLADVKNFLGIR